MKEEAKAIEILKKDLEMQMRKVKVVENNLKKSQEELEQFQVYLIVCIYVKILQNFCVLETKTAKIKHSHVYSSIKTAPIATHHRRLYNSKYRQLFIIFKNWPFKIIQES